jgi:hypothetical protein
LLFLCGYLAGFVLWLSVPTKVPWTSIRNLYLASLGLFFLHRVEERVSGFFPVLASMTGVPVPEVASLPILLLLLASVVAWLAAPLLVQRGHGFGYYLLWTFFASMGITELAHFVLPLLRPGPYGYFPGMLSVLLLAPVAWLGMWRLSHDNAGHAAAPKL